MAADDPDSRVPQLQLTLAQLTAQLDNYQTRLQAMDSRSGVLIAAAAITSGLIARVGTDIWALFAVAIGLLSAVAAAIALSPRYGKSIRPEVLRSELYARSEGRALLWLVDANIRLLELNEGRIVFKARMLQVGFILFTASIAFSLVSVVSQHS